MKKVAIIIVLLSAFLFRANAQLDGLSYGPIAGVSMTSFNKSLGTKVTDFAVGYMVGANVNYRVIDMVGVTFSAAYSTLGGNDVNTTYLTYSGENISTYDKVNVLMQTIDLNLLANVYVPVSFGPITPKVLVGVGNAYNLSADATKITDSQLGTSTIESSSDVTDRFTNYDLALVGGIGTEIKIMGLNTSVDLRYRVSVMDINNVALKPELYHNSFAVVLGVNF